MTGALKTNQRCTVIFVAMPEEAKAVRAVLRDVVKVRDRPQLVRGQLGAAPVLLAITGDGAGHALQRGSALLGDPPCPIARVLVIGVAGALSPGLRTGALIVATEARDERGGSLRADALWADAALHGADAQTQRGIVISAARIADTAEDKQRLLGLCGPHTQAAVVDLESFTFARLAQAHGLPWLALRAVSDEAHEELPALLQRCCDDGGSVRRGRVVRALLTDPRPLPSLLRLRQRVAHASVSLASAATRASMMPLPEARP